jgi:hypothetical protein
MQQALQHWLNMFHHAQLLLVFVVVGLVFGATTGMLLTQRVVGVVLGGVLGIGALVDVFAWLVGKNAPHQDN